MTINKSDFIKMLWLVWQSEFSSVQEDYLEVWICLMIRYGVRFKKPAELSEENWERINNEHDDSVQALFAENTNTLGMTLESFTAECEEFLDFDY